MDIDPVTGDFGFDPVRGIVVNTSAAAITDDNFLYYIHSDSASDLFGLKMRLNRTGRFKTCYESSHKMAFGVYPEC